jgi:hypothetical protein
MRIFRVLQPAFPRVPAGFGHFHHFPNSVSEVLVVLRDECCVELASHCPATVMTPLRTRILLQQYDRIRQSFFCGVNIIVSDCCRCYVQQQPDPVVSQPYC